jgi:hypoxia up-regulated 1
MNNLESFIYKARDILPSASFLEYSTSSERSTLEKLVDAAGEWMYEKEAQTATGDLLKAKLKEMTDIVNPVNKRQKEWEARPAAIAAYEKVLEETTGFVGMIKNGIEKAKEAAESASSAAVEAAEEASKSASSVAAKATGESDSTDDLDDLDEEIPEEPPAAIPTPNIADLFSGYKDDDLTEAQKLYEDAKAYLDENVAKQAKLAITENPAFDVAELDAKAKKLTDQVMRIVGRNVPKWTPPKSSSSKSKSKSKTKSKKSSSSSSSSSASSSSSSSSSSSAKDEL